jgi:hypothetical protein
VSFSKPCELDSTTASASASAYRTDTPLLGLGSPFQRVKLPPSDSHMSTYPQRSYACDRLFGLSGLSATPLHPQPQPRIPIHAPQTQAHDFLAHDMHFPAFFFFTSLLSIPRLRLSSSIKVRGVLGRAGTLRWNTRMTLLRLGRFGLACFGSVRLRFSHIWLDTTRMESARVMDRVLYIDLRGTRRTIITHHRIIGLVLPASSLDSQL